MRLRLGTLPSPVAVTAAATPYLIASTLILGFVIVGLFLRPPDIKPTQAKSSTLIVTPLTLDFGRIGKSVEKLSSLWLSKRAVYQILRGAIVSGNSAVAEHR